MSAPKIVAFAGSSRTGSYNQQLLALAVEAARTAGAEVTVQDLRALALPLFDQDEEAAHGMPESARQFRALLQGCDGMLIASPEYNSSLTPLLKNTIDWVSRTESEGEPALLAFKGKVAALISASPGGLGGIRALVHVRALLGNIGVLVMPGQVSVSAAYQAFEETGRLKDGEKAKDLAELIENLVETARKLKS